MNTLFALLLAAGLSAPAQASSSVPIDTEFCFPAQANYLMVDHSGQNMLVKMEGDDCKTLKVTYSTATEPKITFTVKAGPGFKPFKPDVDGLLVPEGMLYEFLWEERKMSLTVKSQVEGDKCTVKAEMGYDTYNSADSSFELLSKTDCQGEKRESKATLYSFF